ncbi:hypothetical protein ACMD2_17091, partial [Ananas comosus]
MLQEYPIATTDSYVRSSMRPPSARNAGAPSTHRLCPQSEHHSRRRVVFPRAHIFTITGRHPEQHSKGSDPYQVASTDTRFSVPQNPEAGLLAFPLCTNTHQLVPVPRLDSSKLESPTVQHLHCVSVLDPMYQYPIQNPQLLYRYPSLGSSIPESIISTLCIVYRYSLPSIELLDVVSPEPYSGIRIAKWAPPGRARIHNLHSNPIQVTVHVSTIHLDPFAGYLLCVSLAEIARGCPMLPDILSQFISVLLLLVGKGLISSTRNMTAGEHLPIFLFGVGHGMANWILAETFQHLGETISRYFNNAVCGIVRLKDEYIMLPSSNTAVHPRIRDNLNFHPFKNAIGAIDGTHIPVVVRRSKQERFHCRKGFTSQNMMAAVSFDHNFVGNDLLPIENFDGCAKIEVSLFPKVAMIIVLLIILSYFQLVIILNIGKYYLVNSRYTSTDRFLAPYGGERYHISQFDANTRDRVHRNSRDLYNHRHAQLRNVVEKTFGILKKHFKILNVATPFSYKVQCLIAMACYIIHNFIRRHHANDSLFSDELDKQDAEDEKGES